MRGQKRRWYRIALVSRWPEEGYELQNIRSTDRDTWPTDLVEMFTVDATSVDEAKGIVLKRIYRRNYHSKASPF